MTNIANLLTGHIDIWTAAESEKKSGRGRASGNTGSIYGVKKLRELILELAVRGKLVPQNPNDEPANEVLKRIQAEKAKLIAEGKLKKEKTLAPITDDEKPFELPKRWEWTRLQDVYDVRDGTHDTPKYQETGFPLVTSKNLYSGTLDFSDIKYISEQDHLKIKDRSKVDKGDILFAMIGSIGNPVIVDTDIEFSIKNVALFKPYSAQLSDTNYLLKYLIKAAINLREEAAGAVQSFVSLGVIRNYLIPFPPLAEQHRIVAKVDELMALCDQLEQQHSNAQEAHETLVSQLLATLTHPTVRPELVEGRGSIGSSRAQFEENWQRIYAHFDVLFTTEASIDVLKQTLLQLAVMGKLVPQDPNDEPARELLKRIQADKAKLIAEGKLKKEKPLTPITEDEKPFELPMGWEWVRLQDFVLSIISGGTPSKTNSEYWNGDIPWASVKDLNVEKYLESTQDTITILGLKKGSKLANKGDLIICTRMGLGKIAIAAVDVAINQDLKALKLTHLLNVDYFIKFYSTLNITGSGMTVAGIKQDELLGYAIPIPPLDEQHRIVTKVDSLMALCDQLKIRIQQASQQQQAIADALVAKAVA